MADAPPEGRAHPSVPTLYVLFVPDPDGVKIAWAADENDFEQLLERALAEDGPTFIAVRIDDKPPAATTERDPGLIRDRFMRGMGVE